MSSAGSVPLANVLLATARASYNTTTKATSANAAYLSGVVAHIERANAHAYIPLVAAGLEADYQAVVASGVDIVVGDRITSVTLLDGVTPWPASPTPASGELWTVVFIREMSSTFFPRRLVFIARTTGAGTAV